MMHVRLAPHEAAMTTLGITAAQLIAHDRRPRIAWARSVFYWLLRNDGLSYEHIGFVFRRHHSTVMHGVRQVEADPVLLDLARSLAEPAPEDEPHINTDWQELAP
jgi:hypothetical protein